MTQTDSMHSRAAAVFRGERPPHLPLITRIDFWHRHHQYAGTLPEEFRGKSIVEISDAVGIGRQATKFPGSFKYHGLEVRITCNDQVVFHQTEPELDFFPILTDLVPNSVVGTTLTELISLAGKLTLVHVINQDMLEAGVTRPLLKVHPIRQEEDYRVYESIIERAEYIPHFDRFYAAEAALGDRGWLTPALERIPFQSLLLDAIGETGLFYALNDYPAQVERLLHVLDQKTIEKVHSLASLSAPFVEFTDNLEGSMTNPRLFKRFCLPAYQRYASILHRQGKKMGSHTDGNLEVLAKLLPESGLDVCESFTPYPLTPLTFQEAWNTWRNGPMIWGGIPSYYLEARAPEQAFEAYIDHVLELTAGSLIILGVTDAVMADNQISRLKRIVEKVNER